MRLLFRLGFAATLLTLTASVSAQDPPARVTILYDAIGKSAKLKYGWGYSALIEYGGRRVLFDTGGRINDFAANVQHALQFEAHRQLNKIGKPVDHGEWQITPPTVDAYYDPQLNDINFPAGVLQPPLYDAKMDDAPNYGDTGGTIGHELTHAFDDEGSQFDARGNLKNWWTPKDAKEFAARTQ